MAKVIFEIVTPMTVFLIFIVVLLYLSVRKSGMKSRSFQLPDGVEILVGARGPIFRGTAASVFPGVTDFLRELASLPVGRGVRVGKFYFYSSNEIPLNLDSTVVVLPPDAWNIAASKFAEVAAGWEDSPFYFGDCGYLQTRPEPDVGIELIGAPLQGR